MKASITIASDIRARIARGELLPGDPLPVEDELMGEFGCSRPVVREALRILEAEGLVEVRRGLGGGPRVRHLSLSDAAKAMGVYLQIGDVPVLDVWNARDRIIAAAIERLAADSDVALAPLETAVDTLTASVGELQGFNRHSLDVGEIVVELAGTKTEHVLVAALRHIVEVEITEATARVDDHPQGVAYAVAAQRQVADAWGLAVRHIRASRPRAARRAYEQQAQYLRDRIGESIAGTTVGDAARAAPR